MNAALRIVYLRLRSLFRTSAVERELDQEIAFHLDMLTQEKVEQGLDPKAARAEALKEFGHADLAKESCRESWGTRLVFDFWRDTRLGIRMLIKDKGYTSLVLLSLSLGIGAAMTIFAYLNAYLLKPLPFPNESRLMVLRPANEAFGPMSVSYPNFQDWQRRNQSFEWIACGRSSGYNLTGIDVPERIEAFQASSAFLPGLGAKAVHGRLFGPDESQKHATPTVVLTYSFWNRMFNGNPDAVGKSIVLNGEPHTILGVLEKSFQYPPMGFNPIDVWTPIELQERDANFVNRAYHQGPHSIGALKSGVSLEQARADMDRVAKQLKSEYMDTNADETVLVDPIREWMTRDLRGGIFMLAAAVGCLLLIVCVNVAGLLTARAASRNQEISYRSALGAKPWDIIRHLLSENVVLTILGALGGLWISLWGARLLFTLLGDKSMLREVPPVFLDRNMAWAFLGVTVLTGLIFGLFPFLQSSLVEVKAVMSGGSRTASAGAGHQRVRQILVIAEIAMALVILFGAGLLGRSYQNYLNSDPGYNPSNVLTMQVELPGNRYDSDQKRINFYREFLEKAEALPRIQFLGLSSTVLGGNQSTYVTEDNPLASGAQAHYAERTSITPEFIASMGIRLTEGRLLNDQDTRDSLPVALVDERFVQRWWPNQNPIGKRFQFGGKADPQGTWHEIVGVVSHIKHQGIDRESRESVYVPASQSAFGDINVVARCQGDPLALVDPLRRVLSEIDSNLAASKIRTLQSIVDNQSFIRRVMTTILTVFAMAALLLAALGIYGVTAYSVAQRTQEFGIRMALGGDKRDVLQLVLRNGAGMTAIGVAIGLAVSLSLSSLLRSLVFGVSAFDPATFALTTLALSTCVMAACYVPARRAANVNPMKALRME